MSDLSRFSLRPIIVNHFASLRADNAKKINPASKALLFGLPLTVAVLCAFAGFRLDRGGATALLTATGLLVGAMVTGFIFLANLRIKISESETLKLKRQMSLLTSETAVACLYCAGLALGIACALAAGLASPPEIRWDWLRLGGTASVVAGLVHLGVNFLTVLRRLFGVYFSVFRGDFFRSSDMSSSDTLGSKKAS